MIDVKTGDLIRHAFVRTNDLHPFSEYLIQWHISVHGGMGQSHDFCKYGRVGQAREFVDTLDSG